jgi:hypothetical protein
LDAPEFFQVVGDTYQAFCAGMAGDHQVVRVKTMIRVLPIAMTSTFVTVAGSSTAFGTLPPQDLPSGS